MSDLNDHFEALKAYLPDHVEGFGDLVSAQKFSQGQSNPTYLLSTDTQKYVLRAKPYGELLKSAHAVDREFRVMKALSNTNVAVPKVLHLSAEDSPVGVQFYVMEYLGGEIHWDPSLPKLNTERRRAIFENMNGNLAELHKVNPSEVGLDDYGRPGNYFERQTNRWISQYRASATDANADIEYVIDWLSANMPADDGRISLVHGDYRLDNMIFEKDSAKIIGLLDWELSTLGHPFADLAYQVMQWRMPNSSALKGLGGLDRKELNIPSEEDYIALYCENAGIQRISNMNFYITFSFFRLTAILQGVFKRTLDGNASNPETGKKYGAAIPALAQLMRQATQ